MFAFIVSDMLGFRTLRSGPGGSPDRWARAKSVKPRNATQMLMLAIARLIERVSVALIRWSDFKEGRSVSSRSLDERLNLSLCIMTEDRRFRQESCRNRGLRGLPVRRPIPGGTDSSAPFGPDRFLPDRDDFSKRHHSRVL